MQGESWLPEHVASAVNCMVQAPRASGTGAGFGFGALMTGATRAMATMKKALVEYIFGF